MVKRNRNQLIYASNLPDRWLRTAVAVAEPDLAAFVRCWQGSQRMPVAQPLPAPAKKTAH
jgi:hypothetical protein